MYFAKLLERLFNFTLHIIYQCTVFKNVLYIIDQDILDIHGILLHILSVFLLLFHESVVVNNNVSNHRANITRKIMYNGNEGK